MQFNANFYFTVKKKKNISEKTPASQHTVRKRNVGRLPHSLPYYLTSPFCNAHIITSEDLPPAAERQQGLVTQNAYSGTSILSLRWCTLLTQVTLLNTENIKELGLKEDNFLSNKHWLLMAGGGPPSLLQKW